MDELDWDDLRLFAVLARAGSVRAPGLDPIPAANLGLTHRDLRAVSRVHEFMSFLADTFNANAYRLRGELEAN